MFSVEKLLVAPREMWMTVQRELRVKAQKGCVWVLVSIVNEAFSLHPHSNTIHFVPFLLGS